MSTADARSIHHGYGCEGVVGIVSAEAGIAPDSRTGLFATEEAAASALRFLDDRHERFPLELGVWFVVQIVEHAA